MKVAAGLVAGAGVVSLDEKLPDYLRMAEQRQRPHRLKVQWRRDVNWLGAGEFEHAEGRLTSMIR